MTTFREASPLSCDQAEELYLDRAGAALATADDEALEVHLAGCAECRSFASEIDDVEGGLEDLFGAVARGDLAGSQETRFLEALPGLTREPSRSTRAPGGGRILRWVGPLGGLAAAAALLFAFGPSLGAPAAPSPVEVASVSPSPAAAAVGIADAKLELALADVLPGF